MEYTLRSEVLLDRSLDDCFAFFADAANLETITPKELRFRFESELPIEMRRGCRIGYRLSLYGIPFSWLTEIAVWEPGVRFVDQQLRGPFRTWIHEHRFEALSAKQTLIRDAVRYALPLEPVGRLAHPLVRANLDRIFRYREERVRKLLNP